MDTERCHRIRELKLKLAIPIYDVTLYLVVTPNLGRERKKMKNLFGPGPEADEWDAVCSHSGCSTFGLFFNVKTVTLKVVAHEVFHLTHRIMDWAGANFDKEHHEQGALLHGYLMELVCKNIGRLR